jgi:GTP-binding protein Era
MPATDLHCGFVALAGRPNVGKSTLLNALVGVKLSIVTPRPQTTRHRILGLVQLPDAQIGILDTPGLHRQAGRALNKAMNRTAAAALSDADVVVLVLEALVWTAEDSFALERVARSGRPALAVVNKIDRVRPRERLLPYLAELAERHPFLALVPVSALKAQGVERLLPVLAQHLPLGPPLFDRDVLTDRGLEFRIAEMVREKLTFELNQELPYGIAVAVERLQALDGQLQADVIIWVEREGQKPIVIGAGGQRLKRVGSAARRALNGQLAQRVHLNLWVKVRENWADNARALQDLGLDS